MNLQLEGKLALVSGSTKGIGFAIASGLAREGASVIVNGRNGDSVSEAVKKIRESSPGAELSSFVGDLSDETTVEKLVKRFNKVEILVNNVGTFEPKPFEEISDEEWRIYFEVNVLSGVRLSRAYLANMKRVNWGRIIFISSECAIMTPSEMIHYGMTKTAQLAVSRGIAETCRGTAVTVNAVLPGPTYSDGVKSFVEKMSGGKAFAEVEREFFSNIRPSSLLERFATPEEVANLVVYLCSPLSSATTGAALRVDGGTVRSCF